MGNHRASTIKNVFSNWGVYAFTLIANFFVTPFIVHSLGNEVYGTWALLAVMVGYLALLELGVRGAVTRFIARAHAAGDHNEASGYASAGFLVFSITSVLVMVGGLCIAAILPGTNVPDHLLRSAQLAVIFAAGTIAAAFMTGVYGGAIIALQRFDINAAIEVALEVVRITAVVLALKAGKGLVVLPAVQLATGLLRMGTIMVVSRRLYPELHFLRTGWQRSHLRQILSHSFHTALQRAANLFNEQFNTVIVGWFLPIASVTFFTIGASLTSYARSAVDAIAHTVTPRISALEGGGDTQNMRLLPLVAGRVATMILLPIVFTFIFRGSTFIGLWMGPEYAEVSGRILLILSFSLWFSGGRQIISASLLGLSRHRVLVPAVWAEAISNVLLSVALVRKFGIMGIAIGTAVPAIIFSGLVFPLLFSREMQIPLSRTLMSLWVRPSVAMVGFATATFAIEHLIGADSLFVFFAQVAAAIPLAFMGAWFLGLTADERAHIALRLPQPLRRLAGSTV